MLFDSRGFAILCSMLTVCRLRAGPSRLRAGPSRVRLWAEISPFLVYLLSRLSGQDTIYCERCMYILLYNRSTGIGI